MKNKYNILPTAASAEERVAAAKLAAEVPVAATAPEPAKPAPAPEAERLVQLSGRITESDSMKLRLYCIHNKLTTQEWMRQAIRALP